MNSPVILLIAAILVLFHPFTFLWYYERKRGRRLIELAQLTAAAAAVPPVERAKQEVLLKQHELEAKELALKLANRRLGKLDQAKFDFVSVTTHQLRTPLSAIKWTFHMLYTGQLGPVSEEQKVFAQKGHEATDRAINIVNQLLKVDTGGPEEKASRADYHFVPVDLGQLIDSIAVLFSNQMREKNIQFQFTKPTAPLPVEVDVAQMHIVLENLLDNAVKYTKANGQIQVTLSDAKINSARNAVEIVISDSGIGIPESDQAKIFERFFRSSNAIKVATEGNGLGLAIVKDIVDNHQGEIRFESRENGGTTFHLTIPIQQIGV